MVTARLARSIGAVWVGNSMVLSYDCGGATAPHGYVWRLVSTPNGVLCETARHGFGLAKPVGAGQYVVQCRGLPTETGTTSLTSIV
jgi:hypothetical protein